MHLGQHADTCGQGRNGPLVSVIIPTYNYGQFLGDNIESILSQSYRNIEVVVINDGSTDETLAVMERFKSDPRFGCYTQDNQGCIRSMNRGVELSRGDYVAFCGSDDLWNRDHVKLLMEAFEQHPQAGMIFDNAQYFFHESGKETQLAVPASRAKDVAHGPVSIQEVFIHNWITNCNFIVRRAVLNKVGLFDPSVYMTGDLHLLYRIAASYPVYFVDYVGSRLRIHGQNMSVERQHYEYGVRCLEDIREKYPEVFLKIGRRSFYKKLGRKYFRLGRYYERLEKWDDAREYYKKATLARKTRPRYYWSYLRLSWKQRLNASAEKTA